MTDRKNTEKWIEGCVDARNIASALTLIELYLSKFNDKFDEQVTTIYEKEKVKELAKTMQNQKR